MMIVMDFILHFIIIKMLGIVMAPMVMAKVSLTVIGYECNSSMLRTRYGPQKQWDPPLVENFRQRKLLKRKLPM